MSCSSITGNVAPCGPLIGVLPVMQFCPCGPFGSCPPRETAMPPGGLFSFGELSSPEEAMPCSGPVVVCPPREAALPPVGHYINAHYNFSTATCQTSVSNPATCQTIIFIGFNSQPCHLPEYQFTTLSLSRLYCIDFSYQPCHLPDFIALFSFYSPATCQTLFSWFQFTVLPLVRPYGIGFNLQPCHLSVFISLVSVCSPDVCQTLFHGYSI